MAATTATVGDVIFGNIADASSETEYAVPVGTRRVDLQAIGGNIDMGIVTSDTTQIWTLIQDRAEFWDGSDLAGKSLFFKAATSTPTLQFRVLKGVRS